VIGHSPLTPPEELPGIIASAREAQSEWQLLPVKVRSRKLRPVLNYLVEHVDEIVDTIHHDTGKPRTDALATEVLSAAVATNYYTKKAHKLLRPKHIPSGNILLSYKRSTIYRQPFGVIGIISPWNYPFTIPVHEIILALVSGNAVVLKTATQTQMVGRQIESAILSADIPDNVFQYVNMSGRDAGSGFLKNGVDKLFFTGSVAVGKILMQQASETLTPLSLELGGNDAMIICEDADLDRATSGALWAGIQNAGQSCGGAERVYVHESIYDDFLHTIKPKVESLRMGIDTYGDAEIGAMTTRKQVETVRDHVDKAVRNGAKVYAQSSVPENLRDKQFVPAMILTDVNHDMLLMREETFGPVLGVMPYADIKEAISLANDSHLGLTGSVWSRDRKNAEQIARRIQAGAIMINDHLMSHGMAETPWGGFKQSGIGRTHGEIGFDEMTQPQVIIDDRLWFTKHALWWYPYSPDLYTGLRSILHLLFGKKSKLKNLWITVKTAVRIFRPWKP
jgi:succinate-semialdehyde dehydrogenase/glutarate-semialdehyde dehydrogenase